MNARKSAIGKTAASKRSKPSLKSASAVRKTKNVAKPKINTAAKMATKAKVAAAKPKSKSSTKAKLGPRAKAKPELLAPVTSAIENANDGTPAKVRSLVNSAAQRITHAAATARDTARTRAASTAKSVTQTMGEAAAKAKDATKTKVASVANTATQTIDRAVTKAKALTAAKSSREAEAPTAPVNPQAKEQVERTVDNVLGQNLLGDFRPSDLLGTTGSLAKRALTQPIALAKASLGFIGELSKLAAGESRLVVDPADRRFNDPAWQQSSIYAGLLQSYLALRKSIGRYAKLSELDERAQFLLDQIGDALAPNNFLFGNPAALRRAKETYGLSLVRGTKNLLGDILKRRPIPSQVDEKAFKVGGNLAVTPGSVVLRTEMFELIQYAPQTKRVHQRPILVVPSIVNKYYVFDLAPKRSILEYFVQHELTVFVMVWRNPQKRHDRWGMNDYQDAIDSAINATCAISKTEDVNLWAVCGAGPVATSLAGYYAVTQQRKIHSLLLVVSPLDMQAMSQAPKIGSYLDTPSEATPGLVKKTLRSKRISAKEFTLLFAMLRSNDLIWNYWISNYLMGDTPSAFDVLYWNGDGTGMTAQFNQDFSEFVETNPLATAGAMKVRDIAIADLCRLGIDSYVLGAANDHLCIWQAVYRSAQMLGKRSQFVLGNSGHVQTIVCPPGNPKASYSTNGDLSATPEDWLKHSTRHAGSWWDHGVAWTTARAGSLVSAPKKAGNSTYPPLCDAPGTYVHERG